MALKADIVFQKDLFDAANKMRGSIAPDLLNLIRFKGLFYKVDIC